MTSQPQADLLRTGRTLPKTRHGRARATSQALAVAVLLAAAGSSGCLSGRHDSATAAEKSEGYAAARPPSFLVGSIPSLLIHTNDYRARVVIEAAAGNVEPIKGNIFQQEGRILFVPVSEAGLRPGSWAGTFRFLVDVKQHRGYVISERYQAFTTFDLPADEGSLSGLSTLTGPAAPIEKIDGHPCEVVETSDGAGNGAAYRLWRATDLNDLVLRIKSLAESPATQLTLSETVMEALAPDLFLRPTAYAKYSSAEAMINEMARREKIELLQPNLNGRTGQDRRRQY